MKNIINKDFTSAEFGDLLAAAPSSWSIPERVEAFCRGMDGRPYLVNPLGGGPGQREALTVGLHGFDCVTFLESATAFARCADEGDFVSRLRRLRYTDGVVAYLARRHYMVDWVAENNSAGRVTPLPGTPPPRQWRRALSLLAFLDARAVTIWGWPKRSVARFGSRVRSGDLAFFITSRRNLDYFHTGVLLSGAGGMELAHASRRRGRVVIQPLVEFLAQVRMSGVTIVRPVEGWE